MYKWQVNAADPGHGCRVCKIGRGIAFVLARMTEHVNNPRCLKWSSHKEGNVVMPIIWTFDSNYENLFIQRNILQFELRVA